MCSRLGDPARLDALRRCGLLGTDPEPVFDELTKAAAQMMRAPYALLSLMDETESFWKSTYGLPEAMRSERVADSFCQYVVEGQRALLTEDVRSNEITRDNPSIEAKGLRAWAGCPVEFAGEILGTLCVIDSDVREWTAEDRKVLHTLAAIASREIALRAELRTAQDSAAAAARESARVRSLLDTLRASLFPPTLPVIAGIELSAWFAAADDGDMLLGDFYDVFPLGDGCWGVVVGDVCGHGVEAAKLTSLVRYSLRSAAVHHRDPARVMAEVDAAIHTDNTDRDRFATVCYFHVDARDGVRLRWARAGHPYPLIIGALGPPRECRGADGPPLGITNTAGPSSWSVAEFTLLDDERLLIYTDGLTDVRSPESGERLGDDGLFQLLAGFDAASEPTIDALTSYLTARIGSAFGIRADDTVIVTLAPVTTLATFRD